MYYESLVIYDIDMILLENYSLEGMIRIDYVKSKDNVSDPLTKRPN